MISYERILHSVIASEIYNDLRLMWERAKSIVVKNKKINATKNTDKRSQLLTTDPVRIFKDLLVKIKSKQVKFPGLDNVKKSQEFETGIAVVENLTGKQGALENLEDTYNKVLVDTGKKIVLNPGILEECDNKIDTQKCINMVEQVIQDNVSANVHKLAMNNGLAGPSSLVGPESEPPVSPIELDSPGPQDSPSLRDSPGPQGPKERNVLSLSEALREGPQDVPDLPTETVSDPEGPEGSKSVPSPDLDYYSAVGSVSSKK